MPLFARPLPNAHIHITATMKKLMNKNWMNLICGKSGLWNSFCLPCWGSPIPLMLQYVFATKSTEFWRQRYNIHISSKNNFLHLLPKLLHLFLQQVFNEHLLCATQSARQIFFLKRTKQVIIFFLPAFQENRDSMLMKECQSKDDPWCSQSKTILIQPRKWRSGEGICSRLHKKWRPQNYQSCSPYRLHAVLLCWKMSRQGGEKGTLTLSAWYIRCFHISCVIYSS